MTASPRLLLLAAAALFSTGGAVIKAIDLTGWQRASFRSAIAAVFLWIVLPQARRLPGTMTILVALGYAATMVTFVLANTYATSATAIFVQDLAPLFVLLLSPILLNEKVTRRDVIFMLVLALFFALLVSAPEKPSPTASDPGLGLLCATLSCAGWAATILGLRLLSRGRKPADPDPSAQALVLGNAFAFLGALPFSLPLPLPLSTLHPADLGWLLYLGVFQIGLAYVFLTRGLRSVPALEASLLLMLEPVLNPLWTYLFHGETPTPLTILAGLGILTATAIHTLTSPRP